jgi:molybdopterin-guanine dinucleotide biosynthesis protein A
MEVVDTLIILAKGRMIFMGAADKARAYFLSSPLLDLSPESSSPNPVDFLSDLSASLVRNKKVEL